MTGSKKITVLSLEQALALPFATQRMVHQGWRVIRLETPAEDGGGNPGDPNRYIGADVGYKEYFLLSAYHLHSSLDDVGRLSCHLALQLGHFPP